MRISSEKGSEIFVFMPRISFGTFFFFSVTANREIKKNLADFSKNLTISTISSNTYVK